MSILQHVMIIMINGHKSFNSDKQRTHFGLIQVTCCWLQTVIVKKRCVGRCWLTSLVAVYSRYTGSSFRIPPPMPLGGIAAYCSLAEHMQNIQDSHLLDDFQDHFHLPIVYCLVVWNIFYFPLWDVILPIDIHIFQRGRYTTNQYTKSLLGGCIPNP